MSIWFVTLVRAELSRPPSAAFAQSMARFRLCVLLIVRVAFAVSGFALLGIGAWAQGASSADCNALGSNPLTFVSLPGRPFSTVSTSDGCWLFASIMPGRPTYVNGVVVLRRRGDADIRIDRVVPINGQSVAMTITHDGRLLIDCAGDSVVFLDVQRLIRGDSNPIMAYMSDGIGSETTYVNVTSDDKFLFVSNEGTASISVINLELARKNGFSKDSIVGKIHVGDKPIALSFASNGKLLYTTSEVAPAEWHWPVRCKPESPLAARPTSLRPEGVISVIDVESAEIHPEKAVLAHVPAGCSPVRAALSADSKTIWLTVRNDNALEGFTTAKLITDPQNARVAWVPVGSSPVGLVLVPGTEYALVANSNRFAADANNPQYLDVVDLKRASQESGSAIIGRIQAGAFPREFGHSPDGRTIFLSNFLSQNIEVIDVENLPIEPIGTPRN